MYVNSVGNVKMKKIKIEQLWKKNYESKASWRYRKGKIWKKKKSYIEIKPTSYAE